MEGVGVTTVRSASLAQDPLPSWKPGPTKQAIVDLVTRTTAAGSPSAVPELDRIAAFDNDGTLWPEHPLAEAAFTAERLRSKLVDHPELKGQEPFKALFASDIDKAPPQGSESLLSAIAETHAGMTEEAFEAEAKSFLLPARHPRFVAPFLSLAYRPMRELLTYLRQHGFSIYVCTGGDQSFVRAFAPETYGVSRDHVIGSMVAEELVFEKGRAVLRRKPRFISINDKEEKAANIWRFIGRRPLIAVGNVRSGGDVAMLRYARGRGPNSLALVINHDDPVRELAYTEPDGATLAAAQEHGFVVVSMRNDWSQVFDTPAR
jgi:phosphoserine phosphatase